MKLLEANELFKDEEFRLNKWQRLKINVKVDIICKYYKLKHWLKDNI